MKLYIPTHLRYGRQITWSNLPPSVRERTSLVVVHGERDKYSNLPILETPEGLKGIGATRQWILDNADDDHIVMADDDLTFAMRRKDNPTLFVPTTPQDVENLFAEFDRFLSGTYAHVTVMARENGNRHPLPYYECGRAMRMLGFNLPVLRKEGVKFNPELVQDDFDITLQLLRKGYKNLIISWIVQNQSGSGAAGGASAYRNMDYHNASVQKLAALHPDYVTVVKKQTKVAWGGQPRLDVRCQWKKAMKDASSTLSLKPSSTGSESES